MIKTSIADYKMSGMSIVPPILHSFCQAMPDLQTFLKSQDDSIFPRPSGEGKGEGVIE